MKDTSPPPVGAGGHVRGIALMLAAVTLFVAMDSTIKYLGSYYSVIEIVWARYVFHLAVLVLLLGAHLRRAFRPKRLWLQLVRSAFLVAATLLFTKGVTLIPLADASAIFFMAPIVVTAFSMPLLKERVGFARWVGVAVGFLGAVIIIRPGTGMMQVGALFPLAAAVCYALYMIATRALSRSDDALTTILFTAFVGSAACSLVVPFSWSPPTAFHWTLLVGLGVVGALSHYLLILAFEAAPAAVGSPFDYSRLPWATAAGYMIFGDLPDLWTVAGAGIIVGSGLFILRREYRGGTTQT
jgi:drug/metabolite transporter (DMT)-like permease